LIIAWALAAAACPPRCRTRSRWSTRRTAGRFSTGRV